MPDRETQLRIRREIDDGLTEILYQGRLLALTLSLRGFNPDQPRVPPGNPDGGQWTRDGTGSRAPLGGAAREPSAPDGGSSPSGGVVGPPGSFPERFPAAHLPNSDFEDVAYRGVFHDQVRDQLAKDLRARGANVETEVALTLPTHPMTTAYLDLLVQNPDTGTVHGVEVKTGENPKFTDAQLLVYPHLQLGKSVFTLDQRVTRLGLKTVDFLPPIEVKIFCQRGPDTPGVIFKMPIPF